MPRLKPLNHAHAKTDARNVSASERFKVDTLCSTGIISSYCKENNEVASKLGAQVLLRGVLGLPIDADAIPEQEDGSFTVTIVEAQTVRAVEGVEVELYIDGP